MNFASDMTSEIGLLRYCVVFITTISLQFAIWVLMVKPMPLIVVSVIGRLSYLLASKEEDVPRSIPPAKDAPAGNNVSPGAPVHSDVDAIDLAGRIDAAVKRLAQLDARIASGQAVLPIDVWTTLIHAIHVFRPVTGRKSSSYRAIEQVKPDLLEVVVALACPLWWRYSAEAG